jgi:Family of unknown function (DUF6636)
VRPAPAALLALLCAALLGAVAGCGGENDTVTVTATAPAETTAAEDTPKAEDPDLRPEIVSLTKFQTPSGNIGCVLDDGGVRCDIAERDWTAPKPKGCELDFGQGLQASDAEDRASVVCAGDTTLDPGAEVLPYGSVARAGDFSCTSGKAGVTCQDDGDGYGFFISKQAYRLY